MIKAAESCFWKSFNLFMANFNQSYSIVKNKLFKQYCCSFYGAPLWSFNDFEQISVSWIEENIKGFMECSKGD